jgi:hypothetical protein
LHLAGLADEAGHPSMMTHDYKRHAITTLSAAINILDGLIGSNMPPPAPGVHPLSSTCKIGLYGRGISCTGKFFISG